MWGSPELCCPGFCELYKKIRFWCFGWVFFPSNMSLFLLKYLQGMKPFMDAVVRGKLGNAVEKTLTMTETWIC